MSTPAEYYLSFRVGTQWYGILLSEVYEVHHLLMLTELPVSVPNVLGLMTLRNEVFPVMDLRLRFGISAPEYRLDLPIVVGRTASGLVGLVVDDADKVELIADIQQLGTNGNLYPFVKGVANLSDRLLLLLDMHRVASGVNLVLESAQ
jgi:purine-binding chemotaxis protein CheW